MPTKRDREQRRSPLASSIALIISASAALVGLTCAARGRLQSAPAPTAPGAGSPAGAPFAAARAQTKGASEGAPGPSSATSTELGANATAAVGARDPSELDLPHFYADLAALEKHERKSMVRVVWLGDSHTAADYLTGAVRARLQQRFGAGGPGFVRVGTRPYRHTQMNLSFEGDFRAEPAAPSRRSPFGDGRFGFGGVRAVAEPFARATLEVKVGALAGETRWQVWVSLADGASLRVGPDPTRTASPRIVASDLAPLPSAGFGLLALERRPNPRLEIVTLGGAPRFYGVVVEGVEPGLVLDAVGIDGARVATALAWNEASFEAALAARSPSLVVLAFGTNEAFDPEKVSSYRDQYEDLLQRIRRAAPATDCLLVGPPDANSPNGGSEPRVGEIDALQHVLARELGCGFVSQLEIMGGPGSYTHWANQRPALARGDRLHLTPKGYEVVASAISDRLLNAYDKPASTP